MVRIFSIALNSETSDFSLRGEGCLARLIREVKRLSICCGGTGR